jgi:hypothetical protein
VPIPIPRSKSHNLCAEELALLKVDVSSSHVASLRFAVRLGENVEAFGYPLSQVLATTGNFTIGNVTALAGIGDDSRYIQISAPVSGAIQADHCWTKMETSLELLLPNWTLSQRSKMPETFRRM